jgi:hypothetical protein
MAIMVQGASTSIWTLPLGREDVVRECYADFDAVFSPVYAVSAISQHPNTAASSSFLWRNATMRPCQTTMSQRDVQRQKSNI